MNRLTGVKVEYGSVSLPFSYRHHVFLSIAYLFYLTGKGKDTGGNFSLTTSMSKIKGLPQLKE